MEPRVSDEVVDDIAAEALGMPGAQTVETGPEGRALQRDLRETVARLAAASPFMAPPEDLRGRILQATAPATFRMEDYRKVTRENTRYFKWGFYAAMLFMMAAAWYNISVSNQNTAMRAELVRADREMQAIKATLATFMSPTVVQVNFVDQNDKVWARAWADDSSGRAVVIMPEAMVAAGQNSQLVLTRNQQTTTYQTMLLSAPASMVETPTPPGATLKMVLNPKELSPDSTEKVYRANIH